MASRQENIKTALDNVAKLLAEVTANPFPTVSVGGKTVDKVSYFNSLIQQQEALYEALRMAEAGGPTFQVTSRGVV